MLRNLGAVRNLTGNHPAAHRALQQALGISATLSDQFGEANALACLGLVRQATGDLAGAISVLERALATFRDIGSRLGEANALCWLGDVLRDAGSLPEAAHLLNQALVVYREIGNRLGTASALHNLGSMHQAAGDVPATEDLLAQARDLYHDVGDALGEAQTLNQLGLLRLQCGQPRSALPHYRRALAISRSIDNELEADSALKGILECDTAIAVGPAPRSSHLSPLPRPGPRRSWRENGSLQLRLCGGAGAMSREQARHGTPYGYNKHRKEWTPVCADCPAAVTADRRQPLRSCRSAGTGSHHQAEGPSRRTPRHARTRSIAARRDQTVGRVGLEPTTGGLREARPRAPYALAARIPRNRAADGPDCTACTDDSVQEPVHGLGARSLCPATVRNIAAGISGTSGARGPAECDPEHN